MNQINVAVSGFALLTMLIVLAYITLEKGARKRVSVYFRLTVSADIMMLTSIPDIPPLTKTICSCFAFLRASRIYSIIRSSASMFFISSKSARNTVRSLLISIISLWPYVSLKRWHGRYPVSTERLLQ